MKMIRLLPRCRLQFDTSRTLSSVTRLPQHAEVDQNMASFYSISSNPFFSLLGICPNASSLKKIHSALIIHGFSSNILFQTKLLSLYGSFGHIKDARVVFDSLPEPDFYSYKVMMRWYFLHEMHSQLIELYGCLRERHTEFDNVLFSVLLKACSELCDVDMGRKTHGEIVKAGNPDSFVLTGLVDMYSKCGLLELARRVFDETVDKNVVSWTSLISGYVQNDLAEEGLMLFNRMRDEAIEINDFTLGSLATACTKLTSLHQGKWIHGFLIKKGMALNSFLLTTLVDMYVKCRKLEDARQVFDELPTVDLVSWTAMIAGYTQNGHPYDALKLFTYHKGILPNSFTVSTILSACGQCVNLSLGRSIHSVEIKLAFDDDQMVVNALVDMYAKCHMIGDARLVFDTVTCNNKKNLITWNTMISGYYLNGYHYEAVRLFNEMRRSEKLSPDAVSLVTLMSCFASIGALELGSSVHGYSIKEGLSWSNVYIGTALVNLYAKCGDAGSARVVFEGMEEKNAITWSSMIGGCGMQGDAVGSLSLYSDYLSLEDNLEANDAILTTVLSACSHTGRVGQGLEYFDSIIVPSEKHFVCVVDGLARTGRLEEAWDFMERSGWGGISVLAAFLHGCCLYSRFDLGKEAATRMVELRPEEASYYVLLSNFYTRCGDLNKANEVRDLMKKHRFSKSPGCSQVEMDAFYPPKSSSSRLQVAAK
ncbi:pentatricopeptide repeat-containing protein At2g03380, mitochondrial [Impatiens glandulifera]|uniref:pentatricopeptide repeat-containing protein At2g03380, mitochondrial n=1 Tax=Impatiens glandulifera TaxID=253017 RepID=UPI001FB051A6|nr:pentatricopeptide repeat-containing protein At2g03380, mitochondrial [Impatiens glandulifera]